MLASILNALGRYDEAKAVYQTVLDNATVPWARMGLAISLRGLDQLAEAEALGTLVIEEFPHYLAAYDFVSGVREEMGKLWREEGINPTGALGCIPMFLQMPVWIAMYATLFFAIELRHQGAFLQCMSEYR